MHAIPLQYELISATEAFANLDEFGAPYQINELFSNSVLNISPAAADDQDRHHDNAYPQHVGEHFHHSSLYWPFGVLKETGSETPDQKYQHDETYDRKE